MEMKRCVDNQDRVRNARVSKTLASGLVVLEKLSLSSSPIGVRDLGRQLGFDAALVQRLLNTLVDSGFVEQEPVTRRYRIGPKALSVGHSYVVGSGLADIASPLLRELSETDALNSYVGVRSGSVCMYLVVHQSRGALSVNVVPGDEVPLHTTALGKALLADMSDDEIRELLVETGIPRATSATKLDVESIICDVNQIRLGEAAVSDEENITGIFACGAPVYDKRGRVVGALSCACAAHMADKEKRTQMYDVIRSVATKVSESIGVLQSR